MNETKELVLLVQEAAKNFIFAALEMTRIQNKTVKPSDFPLNFRLVIQKRTRDIDCRNLSQGSLDTLGMNQFRAAFAIWAIAVDTLLAARFKGKPYQDPNPDRRAVRCAVYMIRCAFAHNPISPKWQANCEYREIFSIPSIGYSLDARNIDGKSLGNVGFSWFEGIDLLHYAMSLSN
jgi:hypothetical protein